MASRVEATQITGAQDALAGHDEGGGAQADFLGLGHVPNGGEGPAHDTDRKFNRMRPSMARVLGLETRSAKAG